MRNLLRVPSARPAHRSENAEKLLFLPGTEEFPAGIGLDERAIVNRRALHAHFRRAQGLDQLHRLFGCIAGRGVARGLADLTGIALAKARAKARASAAATGFARLLAGLDEAGTQRRGSPRGRGFLATACRASSQDRHCG